MDLTARPVRPVRPVRSRSTALVALLCGVGLATASCGDSTGGMGSAGGGEDAGAASESPAAGAAGTAEAGDQGAAEPFATAELTDVAGNELGTVAFSAVDGGVRISVSVEDLDPGFHGLSVHEHGVCEPRSRDDTGRVGDFLSAGEHMVDDAGGEDATDDPEGAQTPATHPDHAGDLPSLLVTERRSGRLTVVTDRLSPELLTGGDGAAVVVHREPDNHARVPERYAPYGPDQATTSTGDAGIRTGCGVVEAE